MSVSKKIDIYGGRILSPVFFIISFGILFPFKSSSLYKKLLIFLFLFLLFIPVISFLEPESVNYSVYFTFIITFSAILFLLKDGDFKFDSLIFFLYGTLLMEPLFEDYLIFNLLIHFSLNQ